MGPHLHTPRDPTLTPHGTPPLRQVLEEEAISSVVQHLSPFGLNRNLPWQIYATRPRKFAKRPVPDEPPLPPLAEAAGDAGADAAMYALGADDALYASAESALPLQRPRVVLRSVYDVSARPPRMKGGSPRRMRMPGAAAIFPPVRGAEPPGPARAAWLSPRSAQAAVVQAAVRESSPRVLQPQGAYY
jgi:hypothetical protein